MTPRPTQPIRNRFDPTNSPQGVKVRLPDPTEHADRILTAAVAARALYPRVSIAAEVIEGDAAGILVRAAGGNDMLVLGSHGHSRIFHAALGPVAEACVRDATCPVLVIPNGLPASTSKAHTVVALAD